MKKICHVIFICYVCLIVFILLNFGEAKGSVAADRPRRFISFRNFSNFFLRFNFKANMVQWNQIFAQASGFRVNWADPPDSFHPYHRIYRRTVYKNMEILLNSNGLDGFHCVRRAVCEIAALNEPDELYHKILKMIFRQQSSNTNKWHNATNEECQTSILSCPFSFLEVLTYTDIN